MKAKDYLQDTRVSIAPNLYSVCKVSTAPPNFFALLHDAREITAVITEQDMDQTNIIAAEPGWRLLTFEAILPFELTGFLAVVASALAEARIPIFALSAYSTDHILVKEEHLDKAREQLAALGCRFTSSADESPYR